MSYGSLNNSKATAANFHTQVAHVASGVGNFTRNVGAAAIKVGSLVGPSVKAFGKAMVGKDDFTSSLNK